MRTLIRVLMLTLAFAAGTALLGWWSVPLLGAIWGVIAWRTSRVAVTAGAAALLAWGVLLAISARADAFGTLVGALSAVMQLPSIALVLLTLLFPALLAWSAARVTSAVAAIVAGRRLPDERQAMAEAGSGAGKAGSSAGQRPREVYAAK